MPFSWNLANNLRERFAATESRAFLAAMPDLSGAFIDTLFDYGEFIDRVDQHGIATFPQGAPEPNEVAIVGAGPAGMVAAYELLRVGVRPVIYEAADRIGGRSWSRSFRDGTAIAEMGAMRFPATALFMHYVDDFKLKLGGIFPNPGKTRTGLYYQNTYYDWKPNQPPPGLFAKIREDWLDFMGNLGALELMELMQSKENYPQARELWQQLINKFANTSFISAISNGIPKWGTKEFTAFGALGIGTGGFSPLYHNGFLEFIRLIVNRLESDQQLLLDGISGLATAFFERRPVGPDGHYSASLKELEALQLNTPVAGIEYVAGSDRPVRLHFRDGQLKPRDFRAVVVATTTRSMQLMGLTLDTQSSIVTPEVKDSLRNIHLVDSSKMFIRTKNKFWLDDPEVPTNIQTDEMPRGIYCLDYEERSDNGVVLLSYTWGDDSTKLLAIGVEERFRTFKDIVHRINPRFASYLEPVDGEIISIDWQLEPFYHGAFKLQFPSQDQHLRAAYFQFQSVLDAAKDKGVYLAGCSVSWAGGWVESALQTGLNAACAVALKLGGHVVEGSPLGQNPNLYSYEGI